MDDDELYEGEPVKVIPPWPNPWWRDPDVRKGTLVRHAEEDRIFRVDSKWRMGAALKQVSP